MNKNMNLTDFDFVLPEDLIAQHPPLERGLSRLLAVTQQGLLDEDMSQFAAHLRPNDVLIFNDTKVMKARLFGRKDSGGKIELLVERVVNANTVWAHLKSSRSPVTGSVVYLADDRYSATVLGREDEFFVLRFENLGEHQTVYDVLESAGQLPLPPYIVRPKGDNNAEDDARYQTVYAREMGAVAAPTAGLHFTQAMLADFAARGVRVGFVTLHVGAGTFQPVRADSIAEHVMHSEVYDIPAATAALVAEAKAAGHRVIAIGTTSVRALESATQADGRLRVGRQETAIFITPGYQFKTVSALLTNFHLPKSTLLMLVSAIIGVDGMQRAYAHAIEQRYRFFSYGDAMWLPVTNLGAPS